MTAFYHNYVTLCAQRKKSLSRVAEEIGLSRTAPNGWKKGKKPSEVTLAKLASYFDISVSELLSTNLAYIEDMSNNLQEKPILGIEDGLNDREKRLVKYAKVLTPDQKVVNLFWERFYNMCVTHGTKPNPVAKEIGISSGIITKWKTIGALPNGENLIKIADYFGCSVDYLLGRTDSPERSDIPKVNYVGNVNSNYSTIEQNYNTEKKPEQSPSEECAELMRIYTALPFRQRVRLLSLAVELEQES